MCLRVVKYVVAHDKKGDKKSFNFNDVSGIESLNQPTLLMATSTKNRSKANLVRCVLQRSTAHSGNKVNQPTLKNHCRNYIPKKG